MEPASSPESSTHVRADSFYLDYDPMAIFLVEGRLFRVHRHFFIEGSEIFRDMFSQASTREDAAGVAEGMSDEKPIVLSQVTVKEFKALLRFFYAMTSPITNKKTLADFLNFEQDEKLALLSIAHQFVFDNIFEYVCGEFEPGDIPVVDRVRLGDKYCLKTWLSSAYRTILERPSDEQLSQEEINVLGAERTVNLLKAKIHTLHEVYEVKARSNLADPFTCSCKNRHYTHNWYCGQCGSTYSSSFKWDSAKDTTADMRTAITQAVEKLIL